MEKKYLDDLARVVTKAGVILLESGAEVYRVEDSMSRLCYAYGCSTVDSYATPSLLIISFTLNDELSHNVKRVRLKDTNLGKVERVNSLIREVTSSCIDLDELNNRLEEINNQKEYPDYISISAAFIFSVGFAIAFNGTFDEIIISGLIASIARWFMIQLNKMPIHTFFKNGITAFFISVICIIVSKLGICNEYVVINSTIMMLVPGLILTNAIRDSINGDLNSSLSRFLEALYIAIAVGFGSGMAYVLMGGLF